MNTIHKHELPLVSNGSITLPAEYHPLKASVQNEKIYLWCEVNTRCEKQGHLEYMIAGTGRTLDLQNDKYHYFETVFIGTLVWHIYLSNH